MNKIDVSLGEESNEIEKVKCTRKRLKKDVRRYTEGAHQSHLTITIPISDVLRLYRIQKDQ